MCIRDRLSSAEASTLATDKAMRASVAGAPAMGRPVSASKAVESSHRRRANPAAPPATAITGARISFRIRSILSG